MGYEVSKIRLVDVLGSLAFLEKAYNDGWISLW